MQQMLPQQPIPLHVLAEIQRAMAHASVVAKQTGGVPCNPNDIFMQGAQPLPCPAAGYALQPELPSIMLAMLAYHLRAVVQGKGGQGCCCIAVAAAQAQQQPPQAHFLHVGRIPWRPPPVHPTAQAPLAAQPVHTRQQGPC